MIARFQSAVALPTMQSGGVFAKVHSNDLAVGKEDRGSAPATTLGDVPTTSGFSSRPVSAPASSRPFVCARDPNSVRLRENTEIEINESHLESDEEWTRIDFNP